MKAAVKKEKKKLGFSLSPELDKRVRDARGEYFSKCSQAAFRGLIRLGLGEPSGKKGEKTD